MPFWLLGFLLIAPQDTAYVEATAKLQDLDSKGGYELLLQELEKGQWSPKQEIHLHIELLTIAANVDPNLMDNHAEQAFALAEKTQDSNLIALAYSGLGDAAYMQGRFAESLKHFQSAWDLIKDQDATQDPVINISKNLGILHRALGNAGEALVFLELAKDLALEAGWQSQGLGSIYQNLGQLYVGLGDVQAAHDSYMAALQLAEKENNQHIILGTLLRIGFLDLKTGAYQQALQRFEKSQQIYEKQQLFNSGWSQEGRIEALQKLGREDEAIALIGDPQAILAEQQIVAQSELLTLARIFLNRDLDMAEGFAKLALESAAEHPISKLLAYETLGQTAQLAGHQEAATLYFILAIQALEQHAASISNRRQETHLRSQYQHIYQQTIHILNERSSAENNRQLGYLSFHFLQQAKGWWQPNRDFLEQLQTNTAEEILAYQWAKPNLDMNRGDVFVDMALGKGTLWHFVLGNQDLQIVKTTQNPKTISQSAAQLQSMIQHPSTSKKVLREQGRVFLKQLLPESILTTKTKRIIFAADGHVKNVPLAFLIGLDHPSISVLHAPNFHIFQNIRHTNPSANKALILAAPQLKNESTHNPNLRLLDREGFQWSNLPASKREAQFIAKRFESDIFTGSQFNHNTLNSIDLSRFRLIHFATHGFFSARDPLRSALLCTPNGNSGLIEVEDIRKLKLQSAMVVLSACQTATGGNIHQDVHQTMLDAFIEAGSSSVLGSLWTVEDHASQLFMQFFYSALAEGKSSDSALKLAQNRMQKEGWSPYYWAGFILYGAPQTIEGTTDFNLANSSWLLAGLLLSIWMVQFLKYRKFRGRLHDLH